MGKCDKHCRESSAHLLPRRRGTVFRFAPELSIGSAIVSGQTPSLPHTNEGQIPWLDICRASAIGMVLLSHGRFFLRGLYPWTDELRLGGFFGVELFFVLSGFLIGGILIRSSERQPGAEWLRVFYARRWLRTLPNYYLFLVINILLLWLAVRPGEWTDIWRFAILAQNLVSSPPLFFPEAWSLAIEEVFYLIYPGLFLMLARCTGWMPSRAIMWSAVAVIAASLIARMLVADSAPSWDDDIRKVVFLRLDGLMIGVLLAWLYSDRSRFLTGRREIAAAVALLFLTVAYFLVTPEPALNASYFSKTIYFTLVSVGCAGFIMLGLNRTFSPWVTACASFLARVSYAAYLTNIPVAVLLLKIFTPDTLLNSLVLWASFIIGSLWVAYLCHCFVERRFFRLRDRYFPAVA